MDPAIAALGMLEFVAFLVVAMYIARRKVAEEKLPRLAVLSAGIFVAQMVNFPVGGGTTGHLIGGALMALMVGPALAIIGMTVIMLIQALVFGDGGIVSLGLNSLNMAVIAPLVGWGVFRSISSLGGKGRVMRLGIGVASWASVFVSAAACAIELSVSYAISKGAYGIAPSIAIPSMLGYHAVIGIGEAAITVGVLAYLMRVDPEIRAAETSELRARHVSSQALRASLAILAVFAALLPFYFIYSSEGEDGLESTVSDAGMVTQDGHGLFSYGHTVFTMLLAGILGFLLVIMCLSVLKGALRIRDGGSS